ncbi:glutamate/gamma-aminobutyrate family transporter YjeM [Companilactobacillus metriopterae]|uniref:glutamate/gamma-aminobutyrate family transporter YjeM n=1 Tax=Companilactobacillus metriopterae TaxID=1909267 RepID=UPI00100A5C60|nr:glutamate/gamma-aminobutyrate family transporter YjeM [Companilactobacillus metriopterae]
MDDGQSKNKSITLVGLIMMIFTTIYGFANTPVAYEQMGLASIIWYVFAAIFFFLPLGFMMAEYGSAFNQSKGGIYSWIEGAVGSKIAFVGTFIWLASWEVWLVSTSSKIWIPLATFFTGSDTTQSWHFMGLHGSQIIGILAVLWIVLVTFTASQGIDKISKITSIGGFMMVALNGIFLLLSIVMLFASGFHFEESIHGIQTFIQPANPASSGLLGMLSFVVFAIFAYGGMESLGGVTDSMKNPRRDFPRAVLIATVVISILYSLSILLWGVSTNWAEVLGKSNVNLGNITYIMMNNLGYKFSISIGLSAQVAHSVGMWLARFTGLSMFILYSGSFFVLIYSPIKAFVLGTPKEFWPERVTKVNAHGMPANAMWMQAAFVSVLILAINLGGRDAKALYGVLTLMGNVATTVPYLFLVGAFPFFSINDDIKKPYVFYKNKKFMWGTSIVTFTIIALAIIFTLIQPIIEGRYVDAFWTIIGPLLFLVIAWILYNRVDKK